MQIKKTDGKCAFGFESVEIENGKCMDALNFTEFKQVCKECGHKQDVWNEKCINCPLFGRKPEDKQDIKDALAQKGYAEEE